MKPTLSSSTDELLKRDDSYDKLVVAMQQQFSQYSDRQIFSVSTSALYNVYINSIPVASRQYFTCNTCKDFIDRYGGLVVVDQNGWLKSIVWPVLVGGMFGKVSEILCTMVESRTISRAFYPTSRILGVKEKPVGVWDHLCLDLGNKARIYHQDHAEHLTRVATDNYNLLHRHRDKIGRANIVIVTLVASGLTQGIHAKTLDNLRWLRSVSAAIEARKSIFQSIDNVLWNFAAASPAGYCNLGSTVVGELLDKSSGNVRAAVEAYKQAVQPTAYKRPTAAPTVGQVNEAERKFVELGLENSLRRRPALLSEVETAWSPLVPRASSSVFGNIATKGSEVRVSMRDQKMSWQRFAETILPEVSSMSVLIDRTGTYAAITTASVKDSKPLFLWGNVFSWYTYPTPTQPAQWGLKAGSTAAVLAVVNPPYMWKQARPENAAVKSWHKRVFLILQYASNSSNVGPAIFPEMLSPDLYRYRKTIEAYSASGNMDGSLYGQQASGLLLEDNGAVLSVELSVVIGGNLSKITIDRWS